MDVCLMYLKIKIYIMTIIIGRRYLFNLIKNMKHFVWKKYCTIALQKLH